MKLDRINPPDQWFILTTRSFLSLETQRTQSVFSVFARSGDDDRAKATALRAGRDYIIDPRAQYFQVAGIHHLTWKKGISVPRKAGLRILIWRHLAPNQKGNPSSVLSVPLW